MRVLNRTFRSESVLSGKGRRVLFGTVLGDLFRRGSLIKNAGYLIENGLDMLRRRGFDVEKLLWRVISDASPEPKTVYDLAVAYLEGAAAYFTADHVRAKKKAAFIHVDYRLAGYTGKLDRGCYSHMDRIFCVSEDNRKSYLSVYPEMKDKTRVFYFAPDKEEIERKSKLPGGFTDRPDGIRVLTVARLVRQKRLDLSIEALSLYEKRRQRQKNLPRVFWYVLGEGDERKNLENKIQKEGLQNLFFLPGTKSNPYPYFREADLYVHCTGFEGRSIALQEAKMLGKPVIASDCSGNRELIRSGYDGILVPLDASEIADALEKLVRNPEGAARLGRNAQNEKVKEGQPEDLLELAGGDD